MQNSPTDEAKTRVRTWLKILKTSDVVIAAPTGICMLFYYIKIEKPNFCILNLGDSRIMENIYNNLNIYNYLTVGQRHIIFRVKRLFSCKKIIDKVIINFEFIQFLTE